MSDELAIVRLVDKLRLGWPTEDVASSEDGAFGNHAYVDLRGATWEEARETLDGEQRLLGELEEYFEDDANYVELAEILGGLDLGTASVVMALSAAGCVPVSSCNGERGHHEWHPAVAFFSPPALLPDLLGAAADAGCGLENYDLGTVIVYGREVAQLVAFATELIRRQPAP